MYIIFLNKRKAASIWMFKNMFWEYGMLNAVSSASSSWEKLFVCNYWKSSWSNKALAYFQLNCVYWLENMMNHPNIHVTYLYQLIMWLNYTTHNTTITSFYFGSICVQNLKNRHFLIFSMCSTLYCHIVHWRRTYFTILVVFNSHLKFPCVPYVHNKSIRDFKTIFVIAINYYDLIWFIGLHMGPKFWLFILFFFVNEKTDGIAHFLDHTIWLWHKS